ncbi:hypothetical protein U1Q18_026675 [Sarracenia purpurea var. burkii]
MASPNPKTAKMVVFASLSLQKLALLPRQSPTKDPKRWNSVIKHHAKLKDDSAILGTYSRMEAQGILPDSSALPLALKACGRLQVIKIGNTIHNHLRNTNLIDDAKVRSALVDFYYKCRLLDDALYVFDAIPKRGLVSSNAIISGFVGCSCHVGAILLFMERQREK